MFPNHRRKSIKKVCLNIMVCGAPGTGKSTFINSLCEGKQVIVRTGDVLSDYQGIDLSEDVPLQIDTYSLEIWDRVNECKLLFRIIDFPGFGYNMDSTNTLESIGQYLEEQFEKLMVEESKINRNPKIDDSTVHACIYFIEPTGHGLREVDVQFMKQMADKVNVIPVIGRADQLTKFELAYSKRLIMEDIRKYNVFIYDFRLDDDEDEDADGVGDYDAADPDEYQLQQQMSASSGGNKPNFLPDIGIYTGHMGAGDYESSAAAAYTTTGHAAKAAAITTSNMTLYPQGSRPILPLALICSTDVVDDRFVRQYPWGTIDIEDPRYSDFTYLKNALLVSHTLDLKEATLVDLYEKYRRAKLRKELSGVNGLQSSTLRRSFALNKNRDSETINGDSNGNSNSNSNDNNNNNNRVSVSSSTPSLGAHDQFGGGRPGTSIAVDPTTIEKDMGNSDTIAEEEVLQNREAVLAREQELLRLRQKIAASSRVNNRYSVPPRTAAPNAMDTNSSKNYGYGYSPRSQSYASHLTSRSRFSTGGPAVNYTGASDPPPIMPPSTMQSGISPLNTRSD